MGLKGSFINDVVGLGEKIESNCLGMDPCKGKEEQVDGRGVLKYSTEFKALHSGVLFNQFP